MLDIATVVEIIRKESTSRLERGTVIAADSRGTRNVSVRLSGGRACSRPRSCVEGLEPGDEVVVATVPGIGTPVVLAKIYTKYEALESRKGPLAPPDNLSITPVPAALCVRWDTYPGEDLCWQIRYNSSASDTDATDVLVTRGSYYLHWAVDASGDMDTAAQAYFRVRALRWIGDNNVMFSAWSAWGDDTSGGHNLREIVELEFEDAVELTLDAAGAITRTQVYHTVDTFGDAASDNLDTINGGAEGDLLVIRPIHPDRSIVVKDDVDNILLQGDADITLNDYSDLLCLFCFDGENWADIGGGGGGGGASTFLALTDTPASYAGEKGDLLQVNQAENAIEFVTASQDVEVAAAGVAKVIGIQTFPVSNVAPQAGDLLRWIVDAAGCPGTSDISEFWAPSECDVPEPTAEGDMLIANAVPDWMLLARGGATNALHMGAANRPEWQATTDGQIGDRIVRTNTNADIKPKRLAVGAGVNRPDTDGVITLKEIGATATAIAGQGMMRAGQDASGETKAYWQNDVGDEFELAEIVRDVTKTVKLAAGDFTTIQDAIDWFKGRVISGSCIIDVDAGTWATAAGLEFSSLLLQQGASLRLRGDTRELVGISYIDGAVCNPGAIANGGTFAVGNECTLATNLARDQITVAGGTADPDFNAAGIVVNDTLWIFANDGSFNERIVKSIDPGGAGTNVIELTAVLPAPATLGNDGTAIGLKPNRTIQRTAAGYTVTNSGITNIILDGFYVLPVAANTGIYTSWRGYSVLESILVYCGGGGKGVHAEGTFAYAKATTGNISMWHASFGFHASLTGYVYCANEASVRSDYGFIAYDQGKMAAANAIASILAGDYGVFAGFWSAVSAMQAGVRGNGAGSAFGVGGHGYIYAASTNARQNTGTPYMGAASCANIAGSCDSKIEWS